MSSAVRMDGMNVARADGVGSVATAQPLSVSATPSALTECPAMSSPALA